MDCQINTRPNARHASCYFARRRLTAPAINVAAARAATSVNLRAYGVYRRRRAAITRLRRLLWTKAVSTIYGQVSHRWIGVERCYGFITSTDRHTQVHDNRSGRVVVLAYGLKTCRCFNRFIAKFFEAAELSSTTRILLLTPWNRNAWRHFIKPVHLDQPVSSACFFGRPPTDLVLRYRIKSAR